MQKIYEGCLRVTFGQQSVTISQGVKNSHTSKKYRIAIIPLKNLHLLTLLSDLTSPAGDYARAKFNPADKCHASLREVPLELVPITQNGMPDIKPALSIKNTDGTSSRNYIILEPQGSSAELSTDIKKHLGEERCHCRFCKAALKNMS